ncbi:helix-turn-helix domain-containing protein [Bacillus sp. V2I10]
MNTVSFEAKRKDKIIYDRAVELLQKGKSAMDIHREVGLARNTIFLLKKR